MYDVCHHSFDNFICTGRCHLNLAMGCKCFLCLGIRAGIVIYVLHCNHLLQQRTLFFGLTTAVNINSSTTIRVRTGEAKPPPKWMQNLGLATFPSVYPQTPSFSFLKARVGWKILRVGNSAHWKILFLLVN